jgi:hypothetical protein
MAEAKYIRTKNDEIIMFSALQLHSKFKAFEPVSAGFIHFGMLSSGEFGCSCYGESISLELRSKKEDTELATRQLFSNY